MAGVEEVDILWISEGMSCDGDSVSVTAAGQPSIEDVLLGAIPAFIGYTQTASRGNASLAGKPTKIYSLKEYEAMFGLPNADAITVTIKEVRDGGTNTGKLRGYAAAGVEAADVAMRMGQPNLASGALDAANAAWSSVGYYSETLPLVERRAQLLPHLTATDLRAVARSGELSARVREACATPPQGSLH